MSAEAIANVTTAIQTRLEAALKAAADPGTVFVGPLDNPGAQGASLILFPYRIVPNANLRNTPHRVPAAVSPPTIAYPNALPLDIYYLISVGIKAGVAEAPLLRVLGFVMQVMQGEPVLPAQFVTSGGTRVVLAPDPVRVTLEPLTTEEISRIWALFPVANYRTSLVYLASPVWIDPATEPLEAGRVVFEQPHVGQRAQPIEFAR